MLTRRQFLKNIFKFTTLAAGAAYTYQAGVSGTVEDIWYLANIICPLKKPDDKLLYDHHFHLKKFKEKKDLEKIVDRFIEKTDFVGLTMHGNYPTEGEENYESFIDAIKEANLPQIKFSDDYATILEKGDKQCVILRTQEVYTYNPDYKSQELHLNVMGMDYILKKPTEDVLALTTKENAVVTLNHPYSVPNKYVRYWFPNSTEKKFLERIAKDYNMFIEEHNMMNVAWMAASNAKARNLALKLKRKRLAGSDAHMATVKYTRKMIGYTGTLLDPSKELQDFGSLTGKEIIHKLANYIKHSEIESLNNYAGPLMFFNVMVRRNDNW